MPAYRDTSSCAGLFVWVKPVVPFGLPSGLVPWVTVYVLPPPQSVIPGCVYEEPLGKLLPSFQPARVMRSGLRRYRRHSRRKPLRRPHRPLCRLG